MARNRLLLQQLGVQDAIEELRDGARPTPRAKWPKARARRPAARRSSRRVPRLKHDSSQSENGVEEASSSSDSPAPRSPSRKSSLRTKDHEEASSGSVSPDSSIEENTEVHFDKGPHSNGLGRSRSESLELRGDSYQSSQSGVLRPDDRTLTLRSLDKLEVVIEADLKHYKDDELWNFLKSLKGGKRGRQYPIARGSWLSVLRKRRQPDCSKVHL